MERRELSGQTRLEEALFTGLRLTRGIDSHAVRIALSAQMSGGVTAPNCNRSWIRDCLIYDGGRLRLDPAQECFLPTRSWRFHRIHRYVRISGLSEEA